ncbi:hypothetical protein [Gallaecimonas sp. GXIMD4217]|uniref:hypothetical protein n=1 Tax=Gallaecimonas sp. GXIMD4217 TaxID=3131927 RepID=UPI00311B2A6A
MLIVRDKIDEHAEKEIIKGSYDSLWLYWGSFERMFDLVSKHRLNFKRLRVHCIEKQDVSWVNKVEEVEYLLLKGKMKGEVDFSCLPNLRSVELDFNKSTEGVLNECVKAESVAIEKFKGSLSDFDSDIAKNISTLGIFGGDLVNLHGIELFTGLRSLSLYGLRKLKSISGLGKCESIECLEIDSCNNIDCLDSISSLKNLQGFSFENKEIPSLSLLPKDNLRRVRLGSQTKIVDSDVESFLDFPHLEKVTFTKKKGYKYSAVEINELIASQNNNEMDERL